MSNSFHNLCTRSAVTPSRHVRTVACMSLICKLRGDTLTHFYKHLSYYNGMHLTCNWVRYETLCLMIITSSVSSILLVHKQFHFAALVIQKNLESQGCGGREPSLWPGHNTVITRHASKTCCNVFQHRESCSCFAR